MSRTLYRIYLYVMCTALLLFAAFELGSLVNTLLLFTPLRSTYESLPDRTTVVQSSVLAAIAMLLSSGVGRFHYWLIRRDLARAAAAAGSVVRSLALNLVQAAAALMALYAGLGAIGSIANWQDYSGQTIAVAMWIVAVLVFGLVQFERTRTQPIPGPALLLRRIHVYGMATVILTTSLVVVSGAITRSIQVLMIALHAVPNPCAGPVSGTIAAIPSCNYAAGLGSSWLQTLWVALALILYRQFTTGDSRSLLRQVAGFLGFIAGLTAVLVGVEQAFEVTLRWAMHTGEGFAAEFAYGYAFVGLVLVGLLIVVVYTSELLASGGMTALGPQAPA